MFRIFLAISITDLCVSNTSSFKKGASPRGDWKEEGVYSKRVFKRRRALNGSIKVVVICVDIGRRIDINQPKMIKNPKRFLCSFRYYCFKLLPVFYLFIWSSLLVTQLWIKLILTESVFIFVSYVLITIIEIFIFDSSTDAYKKNII